MFCGGTFCGTDYWVQGRYFVYDCAGYCELWGCTTWNVGVFTQQCDLVCDSSTWWDNCVIWA